MRAVKDRLPAPSGEVEESRGARSTTTVRPDTSAEGTGSALCGGACPLSSCFRIMEQRCLKGMILLMSQLQTEDDSHPPFHFLDGAPRQTPDLFAERLIGYRDQLPQQQVAVMVKRSVSFAKAKS